MVSRTTPERYMQERTGEQLGRWPANVILDEEAAAILDKQTGTSGGEKKRDVMSDTTHDAPTKFGYSEKRHQFTIGDTGGASRFFYTAKASSTDRVLGCPPGFVSKHPTVKPLALMRYLVKLTATPTGGTVLDPFAGSGSTLVAALVEGRSCIGIEQDDENYTCCCTRADAALKYGKDLPRLKRFKLRKRRKK